MNPWFLRIIAIWCLLTALYIALNIPITKITPIEVMSNKVDAAHMITPFSDAQNQLLADGLSKADKLYSHENEAFKTMARVGGFNLFFVAIFSFVASFFPRRKNKVEQGA